MSCAAAESHWHRHDEGSWFGNMALHEVTLREQWLEFDRHITIVAFLVGDHTVMTFRKQVPHGNCDA